MRKGLPVAPVQVVHISYHTAPPHPPFNPFMAILLPSTGPSTAVGVACNLGDGLRLLAVKVWASPPPPAQPAAQGSGGSQAVQQHAQQLHMSPAAASQQQSQQQQSEQQQSEQQQEQRSRDAAGGAEGAPPYGGLSQPASHDSADVPDWPGGNCLSANLASMQHGREPAHSRPGMGGGARPSTDAATPAAAHGNPGGGGGTGTGAAAAAEQLAAEISLLQDTVMCCGGSESRSGSGGRSACSDAQHTAGAQRTAAASASPVGQALDWEELILGVLRHQNLRLQSLQDYGTALVAQGVWRGRAGLLAVALLRLRGQEGPAALCLLVHIAEATGAESMGG